MEPLGTVPEDEAAAASGFTVSLENFDGPFDLLLGLIAKRQMDVTTVALSAVTDEYGNTIGQFAAYSTNSRLIPGL